MKKFIYLCGVLLLALVITAYHLYGPTSSALLVTSIIISLILSDAINATGGQIGIFKRKKDDRKLLDVTVLTDSRCLDIIMTGFLGNRFIIPKFLIDELHKKAKSEDEYLKNEARRALDIITRLKENDKLSIEISKEAPSNPDLKQAIIEMAKRRGLEVVTFDYSITKLGIINDVKVLNINDLYLSLKQTYLPGDELTVFVVKEGKEKNQGVGYLEDGTMVVVDNGYQYIGKKVNVLVQSILKSSNGKIIFTRIK